MSNNPFVRLLACSTLCLAATAQNDMLGIAWGGATYDVNAATGTGTSLGLAGQSGINSMARIGSSLVCVTSQGQLVDIDPATGAGSVLVNTWPALTMVTGLAADSSGMLYAVVNGGAFTSPDKLYTINPTTGTTSFIGDINNFFGVQSLAIDDNDNLYAWDVGVSLGSGQGLLTIDPNTGAGTDVNPAVGGSVIVQSLAFSTSGQLYGARNSLYTIDTTTGIETAIGSGGYNDLRGIEFVVASTAADCTPWNGSGSNPNVCTCATLPVLGSNWNISITAGPNTIATYGFASANLLGSPVPIAFGERLLTAPYVSMPTVAIGSHQMSLPANTAYIGFTVSVQGLLLNFSSGSLSAQLTNAQTGYLGL